MTVTAIRQRLIDYLEDADDKKVKAIYTLLEEDIEQSQFILSKEQIAIVEKEKDLYLKGLSRSYSREEAIELIKQAK